MGQVAIVTGGSSGIGAAAAEYLAAHGCTVYEFSRHEKSGGSASVHHVTADVTDEASVAAAVQSVLDAEGRIDILLNNAGFGISGAAEFTSVEEAKRQLEAQPGEDYGFDAPRLVVNVSAAGESTTLTVGAENPVTGDVYVRREGGDAVYTVDAARFRCMEQTKAELFGAFSPAGITVSDIEAVSYTLQSGETIKLQSVSQPTEADSTTYQTVWQLTDEPNAALDTDKTDALLAALASYVTGQDTAADLSACGFDAPLVTAEVTTADGTVTLTYAIGTDGYYMMVSGDSSVYTVDGQTVQALCLTARQLKADT